MFLKLALYEPELRILDLALTSYPDLEDILLSTNLISERKLISLYRFTRNKLIIRYTRLLEVYKYVD